MRLLDLFSGAGGAARGYQLAGFHVTGVDNRLQPRYCGDAFIQADALEYVAEHGRDFDAIHVSPPCQGYSIMQNLPWLRGREYPLLILPTLEILEKLGKPFVLENVMGARHGAKGLKKRGLQAHGLKAGWLCGAAFGKPFYRLLVSRFRDIRRPSKDLETPSDLPPLLASPTPSFSAIRLPQARDVVKTFYGSYRHKPLTTWPWCGRV